MIHHGDLFDVLPTLPAQSIHACVTDPPYGIGFMGKQWDTFKPGVAETRITENKHAESDNPNLKGRKRGPASSPSAVEYDRTIAGQREFQAWTERWASEVFRVLRPGAHMVVCGAPRSYHRMASGLEDAGFEVRDCLAWIFGQGFPKSLNLGNGIGTALKPAYEPIVLCRRPLAGTVAKNIEKFACGAMNIDACRIEGESWGQRPASDVSGRSGGMMGAHVARDAASANDLGRWPANVLLDEEAAALLDEQSGELTSGANPTTRGSDKFRDVYSVFAGQAECQPARGVDVGGASRFFYVAKPSREEREMGCYDLTGKQRDETRKPGDPGGDNPRNRGAQLRGNFHPTVKPIELMRWLVRLITPPDGTVLDPFTGSGTTGCACAFELRPFVGIEREADYVQIAERRIAACAPLFSQESA